MCIRDRYTPALARSYTKAKDAILLSKVRALTLHAGKSTSHNRIPAIPQLTCVGGNGCRHYEVETLRCKNSGSEYDAEDIQWTCQAELPREFKLGGTEVVCEGFDGPDDPWILKGSCGVEYRLFLTEEGEAKYGSGSGWRDWGSQKAFGGDYFGDRKADSSGKANGPVNAFWSVLFWGVFGAILLTILWRIFIAPRDPTQAPRGPNQGFGGNGGGGFDDGNDPPPPYTPRSPPKPKSKSSTPRSAPSSSSGGSGFWSGAAAGGAAAGAAGMGAGYYMGSRIAEQERERARQAERELERSRERERERQHQSSFFGGRPSSAGGGSSFADPSSASYESTGFGGTRRR